jgi:hypothetical protein
MRCRQECPHHRNAEDKAALGCADWFDALAGGAFGVYAGFDVGGGVPFAQGLLDFIFDGAGDGVALIDGQGGGDDDVEIDPVIAAAVAMAEFVIGPDVGLFTERG